MRIAFSVPIRFPKTGVYSLSLSLKILLIMLIFGRQLGAQAGALSFGTISVNSTTGNIEVPIIWSGIGYTTVNAVNIDFYVSAPAVCVDADATKNSVVSPFANSNVTVSGGSVQIYKSGGLTLSSSYSPLITLYFRAAPNNDSNLGFSTTSQINVSGFPLVSIGLPATNPQKYTLAAGYVIGDHIRKAPLPSGTPAECDGGSDLGIPNIEVDFNVLTTGCFPGNTITSFSEHAYDGYYEALDNPSHFNYKVTPTKEYDTDCGCGVNTNDIDTTRRFILGAKMPATLQQLIAADFTGNDTVNTTDLVEMDLCRRNLENHLPGNWLPWVFVPQTNYDSNSPPASATIVPPLFHAKTIWLSTANNYTVDFYGIKRGDVLEQDCTECDDLDFVGAPEDRESSARRDLMLEDQAIIAGREYLLPLRCGQMKSLGMLGLELMFDPAVIEILGVEPGDLSDDLYWHRLKPRGDVSALHYAWYNLHSEGEDLPGEGIIAVLHIKAKCDAPSLRSLLWQSESARFNSIVHGDEAQESRLMLRLEDNSTQKFMARLAGANPVDEITRVEIFMPQAGIVRWSLADVQGRVSYSGQLMLPVGWSECPLGDLRMTAPGVISFRAFSDFGSATLRLIRQ